MPIKTFFFLLMSTAFLSSCGEHAKTGFISLSQIYEKFPLKKEMETKVDNMKNYRKSIADSMAWHLKSVSQALNQNATEEQVREFQRERQALAEKKEFFEQDNQRALQETNVKIWKQINQYIKDYGEQNGYDYIYGADGTGTLMYADKKNDITTDVSLYVNKRYAGSKK
jgi:outer membrane protein